MRKGLLEKGQSGVLMYGAKDGAFLPLRKVVVPSQSLLHVDVHHRAWVP